MDNIQNSAKFQPAVLHPAWTKPETILFATGIPANEKAFGFALAQAAEYGATLSLFHVYDTPVVLASEQSGIRYYDYAAAARAEVLHLEPLAQRALEMGVRCEVVVRPGLAADQILAFLRERAIDRVVMGTHSPGPIGKLQVGSVAEAILRGAHLPVYIVGPEAVEGSYRYYATRTILCAVSQEEVSSQLVGFAARLAVQHGARLVLQHVLRTHERAEVLAGHSIQEIESDLLRMVPIELMDKLSVEAIVVPGEPAEELLYQSRAQQADLIVLGAQGASALAALTRQGVAYKVLAHAHCPVISLSRAALEVSSAKAEKAAPAEVFPAGIF
jgi:nucleotide-binding universal stress UspA family protein